MNGPRPRPRAALACAALAAAWTVILTTGPVRPDPWPARITDDMTAVQVNETSLGANPADSTAYRECLDHVAAYNADTTRAPGSIPPGLPDRMTAVDACGPNREATHE